MVEYAIETRDLVRDYGSFRALHGVSLQVERGEVFGFLGPNGAGKSTLIRVLLNLLSPTSGSVRVLGQSPIENPSLRASIGYLPGELGLAGALTGRQHLTNLCNLRGGAGANRMGELSERFALDLDKKLKELSKGNKQKIGVVQAFMADPELLILDEPTSGLDPLLQHEFLDLVSETSQRGATVFMSSHMLSEVEAAVGRVAIIREGLIVGVDEISTFRSNAGQHVSFEFADPVDPAVFDQVANFDEVLISGSRVEGILRGSPDRLLKTASQYEVIAWSAQDNDLEELFLEFYRETLPGDAEPERRARG